MYSPANAETIFFRPTDGSGTIAGDFIIEFSEYIPQIQGEVVAVHPHNKKIRVGDWVFFREHAPVMVKCLGGKYYTLPTSAVYMLIRSDDVQLQA